MGQAEGSGTAVWRRDAVEGWVCSKGVGMAEVYGRRCVRVDRAFSRTTTGGW